MAADKREILDVLKSELCFIEQGGYGRSIQTPWKPMSIFKHSPACINFSNPVKRRPCTDCKLTDLVPVKALREEVPCHHIPLNAHGETVYTMERQYTQVELEEAVRMWLRNTIERLEKDQALSQQAEA